MRFMTMVKSKEGVAGFPPPALMEAIAKLGMDAGRPSLRPAD